jgi:hypothetical protein
LRQVLVVKNLIGVALLLFEIPSLQSPAPSSLPAWSRGVLEFHQLSTESCVRGG